MTLKDYKDNFRLSPTCHLVSPSKNKLGKVSKQLVERVNSDIIDKLQFNQWDNTNVVLKQFNNIADRNNCSFI